jgi:peptide/nickel transport system permease protein
MANVADEMIEGVFVGGVLHPHATLRDRAPAWKRGLRIARNKPLGSFGAIIVIAMLVLAVAPSMFQRYDPGRKFHVPNPAYDPGSTSLYSTDRDETILDAKAAPSATHWLGTDETGGDIWAQLVQGARRSLGIGMASMAIAVGFGLAMGVLSGYFGGVFDTLLQRILDAMQAFPPLLLLLLVGSAFSLNNRNLVIVLGLVGSTQVSRLVRAKVLTLRELPFIEAGRVIGASDMRLMLRHITPNSLAPAIVIFTLGLGTVIIAEAGLSFLGVVHSANSWGYMLNRGRNLIGSSPWLAVFSGLAITLAVLAFNLIGDALRDVLDPRLRV